MYVVGTWLDKIQTERKEVQKWFKKLEFFATNLKPRSVLSSGNLHDIDLLVKSAFDCHLDKEDEKVCFCCIVFKQSINDVILSYRLMH